MKRAPLWIGIVALWLALGAVGAWLVLTPAEAPPTAAKPELALLEDAFPSETAPLRQTVPELPDDPPAMPPAEPTVEKHAESIEPPELTEKPEVAEETTGFARTDLRTEKGSAAVTDLNNFRDLEIGGTLTLGGGEVSISGNVSIDKAGKLDASRATLVFDGADQTLEGELSAKKVILRGGTKRIRAGTWGTNGNQNAEPGKAGLYVEAGTTLIIEAGGKWTTPNPYGFQIAGNLVIDGGEFVCRFSNGNGTDRGEKSWLEGSTLTIYSGKFVGNGDADFSGATITIHDGSLEINDDIWSTGDALTIHGGSMRNTTGGGMFAMTGTVQVHGGKLQVYQNSSRSLRVGKETSLYCTGGEISINGRAATGDSGGILLQSSATLPDLVINASTRIHKDTPETAYLSVNGDMQIAKGQKFEAHGRQVISNFVQTPESGEFVP
ncbi:MAG: hypothetical protein K8I27_13630 [Planctomycetes bacterium]|nr:hypothetical protein [Planctomycetota bacterium]